MNSRVPPRGVAAAAGVVLTSLCFLAACSEPVAEAARSDPVTVVTTDGKAVRITLTPKAAERLGVRTTPASAAVKGGTSIPAAAILYSADGKTFVYTKAEDNVYVPAPVVVVDIIGDTAHLSSGPAAGTHVVTVAAAELYGAETGLGAGH